jgi:hypothetical protein
LDVDLWPIRRRFTHIGTIRITAKGNFQHAIRARMAAFSTRGQISWFKIVLLLICCALKAIALERCRPIDS